MDAYNTREAIGRFLFVSDPPEAVDLAFVLCSPTVSSIIPAVSLYKSGLASRILISGAGMSTQNIVEWSLYRNFALEAGVPQEALLIERNAKNTRENIILGKNLIAGKLGWHKVETVAICAKPFHMRRAIMTARKHFPAHVRLIARPPEDPGDLSEETWWQSDWGRTRVLDELGKISQYARKGDLGDF